MPEPVSINVTSFGLSDIGLLRSRNEDSFLADDNARIYAVADGLGGLPGGDVASDEATRVLFGEVNSGNFDMEHAFMAINDGVQRAGASISTDCGIGTTLTAMKLDGNRAMIGHVGDTGVLLFRDDRCIKLTRDHTVAEEVRSRLKPGQQVSIPDHYSHTLTRCIGQIEELEVDLCQLELIPGDRLLMFSDGVTKTHSIQEIEVVLRGARTPEDAVRKIIRVANERGGPDNCTAVAVFISAADNATSPSE